MAEMALPCIVCERELRNVDALEVDNQPNAGVSAVTPGNYGSRVFDSFDGEVLEFNVCDPCLIRAGEQGRVLASRPSRPVAVNGVQVGWEKLAYRPVLWHQDLPGIYDRCDLDLDELDDLPKTVRLDFTPEEIASWFTEEGE